MALLWGGMVVWTAVEFVGVTPSARHDGNSAASDADEQITNEDAAALKGFAEGK